MKFRLILFIAFIGLSATSYSQSSKLFSADMELSNSLVNQVYQDRNGIIWIATEDGLNRYDGSKFSIYKHEEKNLNSLQHNYIRQFLEDSRGNFYIGYFSGAQHYDRSTDTFTKIPLILQNGDEFNAYIASMLERKNGQILIGTSGHGIFELVHTKDSLYAKQIMIDEPSVAIETMMEDKDENLWVSTDDKGLYRINKNNEIKIFFNIETSSQLITSICQDQTGTIYAGSLSTGLYKLDPATDTFVPIPYTNHMQLPIKALYVNRNNEILIGTDGNGMKIYKPGEAQIGDESFNVMTFDFSKSKVHSILEDENRNIWLGIFQKGVLLLPARSGAFEYIGYKSVENNLIGSNCIMSLCKDRDGTMWVGTDSDGVYGITPDGKRSVHFAYTGLPGSVPSTIMCIFEDSDRNLWLGSYLHGLAKLDRRTGKCQYISGLINENQFPVQRIYSITEDNYKNLWIGTHGGGLFQLDIKTNKVKLYDTDGNYKINRWIISLLKARSGRLYVGTHDGLYSIDLKTQENKSNYQNHLLSRHVIQTLYEDSKGMLWIGTSEGLTSYDQRTSIIVTYTMNDGLPSNVICAIQEDKRGHLWISTNRGISHFNPQERQFTNYYANDGLQSSEFSKNASYAADGLLYFAGLNGITCFRPEEITIPEKVLQVRLTDFYIHDQPVKKGMKSGFYDIIDTPVMEATNFHLAHNDNSFTIEFATTEFSNPERIVYSYSMNSDDWIRLRPGTNRVSFNNLTPGKYKFKVMAQDFNFQSDVKEIDILISPAWYLSFWAKCAYWLIAILVVYLIALQIRQRYKARQEALEHLHIQEINEAKLQFFINVSHEIRTPMSLVMSPLKKLMVTDKDSERQKAYTTMNRNIDRILNLINQLMDIRKIDKGQMALRFQEVDVVRLLKDIHSIFEERAKEKGIDFQFHHNTEQLNAWVDLRNFDKVIINVLSNAFKFTPENGEVAIYVQAPEKQPGTDAPENSFEVIITDSGIGIDESEIERIFDRFYQAKSLIDKSYEGTGVGLHLARSIMELHHGSIRAENKTDGKGSRFIIRLPLGNGHLKPEEIKYESVEPVNEYKEHHVVSVADAETEEVKFKSKSKRYVLVVDDDKDIREYVCRELSSDYHTIECSNGKEALDTIFKKTPDLVISDVVMPEMDGITLCRKIKQNININHVPVILLTARSKEEDNLEGLDIGADAYIVKPFNIEVLKKTVQNIIKNREMLRNNFSGNQQQKDKISKITMKSPDDKLLERIMKVVNKNIANPELNVEMIATEVGISRVHLHRKLKELTNQSTRDLVRNIRLQQAASLLSSKKLTVSEVATATGFTNLTHFSTAFKEAYGMPPVSYMEMHLNQRENEEEE